MGATGVAAGLSAGRGRWRDVSAFLDEEQAAGVFPGSALIVSRKGRILFERYAGTCCRWKQPEAPLTADVSHPLYSFSKLIGATVVAMARQDGLLDYDMPASAYIPEFTGGGKDRITLRHLLTHSAGIPDIPLGPAYTDEEWRAALKAVCAAKTAWEPGTRTAYHGLTGLFVAAEAVRRVTGGRRWEAIFRERLFDPIGARSLTFDLPAESAPAAITPQPQTMPASLKDAFPLAGHPAGGCFGTAHDALKILQLHLNRGAWGRRRLLRRPAFDEMHTVQYSAQIAKARAEGRNPEHEPWGLGPLLRGEGPKYGGHDWFGFGSLTAPGVFGHAGIDTVIGVADPGAGAAMVFITTGSPKPPEKTVPLRNAVTNRVFASLT
ncbi:MAG: beta-lactamase family protein [Armatimonadetes bacterium]|nr:beta-lactamase family protein [Armatimonadota bacterium]